MDTKKKTPEESRVLEVHFMDFETRTFIPMLSLSTMHNEICQGPTKKDQQKRVVIAVSVPNNKP
ncbi:MAG: hypothetical protein A2170_04655 [Deltaproteobacteria bacterium RBG_13_53_10]|nr:MAG: hypothetical protein A2170_04655 [Deltaproteobacteria bacterium RBG_13_53_10]